ncbi:MAG: DUF6519 domain-containing protein, partial [Candidatus Nanopelagicales bacterium]
PRSVSTSTSCSQPEELGMYGDFSRLSFNRARSYTSVWSQQGRMQLDSDFNEQTAILLDWLRTLAIDFIGPAGGHISWAGFGVSLQGSDDLVLAPGHYYVAGMRCVVPPPEQPDALTYSKLKGAGQPPIPTGKESLVYLRVWERSVNALQDPLLLEPALGPAAPDTTIRTQVAWSLGLTDPPRVKPNETLPGAVAEQFVIMNDPPLRPVLHAKVAPSSEDDPVGASVGYSGLDNQLYRVEIHRGNDDPNDLTGPTFKWSRDNGSVEFGFDTVTVDETAQSTQIQLTGGGLPGRPQLEIGDCVEVIDNSWEPFGSPGPLLTVGDVDPVGHTVTLAGAVPGPVTTGLLRRWDSVPDGGDGSPIPVGTDEWIRIESGIHIQFTAANAVYRRGDFWVIPARAATGTIYGPTTDPGGSTPYGPERCFAPLALIRTKGEVVELRSLFTHLAWPDMPGS